MNKVLVIAWVPLAFAGAIVAALLGAPDAVSTAVAAAILVGPLCYWLTRHGAAATTRDRTMKLVMFGVFTAIAAAVAVGESLSGVAWVAVAAWATACLFGSVVVAVARSGDGGTVRW